MSFNHIMFDENSQYGNKLRGILTKMEESDDELTDIRDVIIQMCDSSDTSSAANFAEVVKRFGVAGYDPTQGNPTQAQLDAAKAMFVQIDTAWQKTNDNNSKTNVRSARDQLFSQLR